MTTQYLIRKVEMCPACKGEGYVWNEKWQALNEANNAWMQEQTGGRYCDEAHADWERRVKETWPYSDPPPEDEPCGECEGTGKVEEWIDLRQAMEELGISTKPHDWDEQQVIWESLERKA